MELVLNIVCLVLLTIALVLNLRAYRKLDPAKKFQGQIGLTLTSISLLLMAGLTFLNMT